MNEVTTIAGALLAGLLGSAHCMGMCGGIAGAIGAGRQARPLSWAMLYNLGRVGSYALAGAFAGGVSFALGSAINLPLWSMITRGLTGTILILIGLNIAMGWRLPGLLENAGSRVWALVSPTARRLLASRSAVGMLGLGALWGWLPCGLTYTMLLAAAGTGQVAEGSLLMMAFGLGTLPAMVAAGAAAGALQRITRSQNLRRVSGALLVVLGAWTAAYPIKGLISSPHATGHHHMSMTCPEQDKPHSGNWIEARNSTSSWIR